MIWVNACDAWLEIKQNKFTEAQTPSNFSICVKIGYYGDVTNNNNKKIF